MFVEKLNYPDIIVKFDPGPRNEVLVFKTHLERFLKTLFI